MKKYIFFFTFASIFFLGACHQNKQEKIATNVDTTAQVKQTEKFCFMGNIKADSVFFEMERYGDKFKGFIFYKRYLSDASVGEYVGNISGDTISGLYTFQSEGMISKVEKKFLWRGDSIQEAIGTLREADSITMVFAEPLRVKFGESYTLHQTQCSSNFIDPKIKQTYQDNKNKVIE